MAELTPYDRFLGLLSGTAVGDALGLPAEGLRPGRIKKFYKDGLRHRFIFGRGMTTDDTDHTMFVSECMLAHPDSPEGFAKRLGWCLRLWLLSLPAGLGSATLRSIFKLWCGIDPDKSGVASAGNGPAMRSAIIGAAFYDSPQKREQYLKASTIITHSDNRALIGSRAVALAASWIMQEGRRPDPEELRSMLNTAGPEDKEWQGIVEGMTSSLKAGHSVQEYAHSFGQAKGVGGYIYHTVPVALYAWHSHYGDYRATVTQCIMLGGDTDTVAAIAGALAGCATGVQGIPEDWTKGLWDFPRCSAYYECKARALAEISQSQPRNPQRSIIGPAFIGYLGRDLLFILAVYAHLVRRLYWAATERP